MNDMIRESELQEMEQKWKAENERIMREHSEMMASVTASVTPSLPAPAPASAEEHPNAAAVTQPAGIEAPAPAETPHRA